MIHHNRKNIHMQCYKFINLSHRLGTRCKKKFLFYFLNLGRQFTRSCLAFGFWQRSEALLELLQGNDKEMAAEQTNDVRAGVWGRCWPRQRHLVGASVSASRRLQLALILQWPLEGAWQSTVGLAKGTERHAVSVIRVNMKWLRRNSSNKRYWR